MSKQSLAKFLQKLSSEASPSMTPLGPDPHRPQRLRGVGCSRLSIHWVYWEILV